MIGLSKWQRVIIMLVWVITQIVVLLYYGIYTLEEAEVYTNIATNIVNGNFNHSIHYWLYSGYIGILVCLRYLGLPFESMYFIQLAISFTALYCFLKLLARLPIKEISLFVGALIFASSPLFHAWNSHLYTDGFFGSLVVIGLHLIVQNSKGSFFQFSLLFVFLVFVSFVRPVGFLIPILAVTYIWIEKISLRKGLLITFWIVGMLFFIKTSLKQGSNFFYPNHNLELNVICGYPSSIKKHESVPYNSEMSIIKYFTMNPKMTFSLILNRAYKSLWMTRPYFSKLHNGILVFICLFYYTWAFIGIVSVIRNKNLKIAHFLIITLIWLVPNILFCADWHNRFMIPMMPGLLLLVTLGINSVFEEENKVISYKKI
jgi:hypothetical protein